MTAEAPGPPAPDQGIKGSGLAAPFCSESLPRPLFVSLFPGRCFVCAAPPALRLQGACV